MTDQNKMWRTPWTAQQVEMLNACQDNPKMHPYTCGNDDHGIHITLVATTLGWTCPEAGCGYRQDWAYPLPQSPQRPMGDRMSHYLTAGQTFGMGKKQWLSDPHNSCTGREQKPGETNPCRCCCTGCETNCAAHWPPGDHACINDPDKPARYWSTRNWDTPWWKPLILDGIRGGDEWCNRIIGLKLFGTTHFLNLTFPMRTEQCEECRRDCPDTPTDCYNPFCAKNWCHKGDCTDMEIDDALIDLKMKAPELYEKFKKILES